jgi:hypothetical protein
MNDSSATPNRQKAERNLCKTLWEKSSPKKEIGMPFVEAGFVIHDVYGRSATVRANEAMTDMHFAIATIR